MPFAINISPDAFRHLESLRKRDQAVLLDEIESKLRHQPLVVTRNRKPMRSNILATWELRVGDFRVYYDVETDDFLVIVRAIGSKVGNRLFIAGEEIELP